MSNGLKRFLPWAGHPEGLPTLFMMEMWERFSYYGMKAILVLFLMDGARGGWGLSEGEAYAVAAVYTALVYLSPLFGGWIADRWLKQRKAVYVGGLLIAAGHFALALQTVFFFKLGLAFLILGNGLFKPNVSVMVGELYPQGDPRKDGGYSVFYSGINWGALLGIFICGYLGEEVSWHLGFGAAGVAMLLGLVVFAMRQGTLNAAGLPKGQASFGASDLAQVFRLTAIGLAFGVVCILALPLLAVVYDPMAYFTKKESNPIVMLFLWRLPLALALVWLVNVVFKAKQAEQIKEEPGAPLFGFGIFIATVAFFIVALGLGQTDGLLTVFAKDRIDLNILGIKFPASWVQNLNPVFVVLLAPAFARLWGRLPVRDITKQAIGLFLLAGNFWLISQAQAHSDGLLKAAGMVAGAENAPRISILWLFGPYLLLTLGELCISPVGLAMVQKLSPTRLVSVMMAIYLLGSFAANTIANPMAGVFSESGINMWTALAAISAVMGGVWLVLAPLVNRMSRAKPA